MAAISIVSGTSLNAFFHPCENLQSIAIQRAWHSASLELLSCIAKNKSYMTRRLEKWGQANVLSCHWNGQRWNEREPRGGRLVPATDEGTSCVLLGGPLPQTSRWYLGRTISVGGQEDLQGFGTAACSAENLLLAQLRYGWIPSIAS